MNDKIKGHLAAGFSACVWGCTFVASKVLLEEFNSVEVLFTRFLIGFITLLIMGKGILKFTSLRQELYIAGAGITGISLYYMLENLALTYTQASNVSVITCTAPFFTALMVCLFFKNEKLSGFFVVGFILAIVGISLISFNGSNVQLEVKGTVLAVLSAFVWGIYSVFIKKLENDEIPSILLTQRIFFYGLIGVLPFMYFMDYNMTLKRLLVPAFLLNFLFLGAVGAALCFATWNFALTKLGAVSGSVYIYLIPVITVIVSIIVLHEVITPMMAAGIVLTLAGLVISEIRPKKGGD